MFRRFWLALMPQLILNIQLAPTILGICEQYTIDSMVYLIENEVDRWHICLETRMFGPLSRSRLSEDEIAEFVTKTEGKKRKNKQNILLDGFYLLFLEISARKKHLFVSWNAAEK